MARIDQTGASAVPYEQPTPPTPEEIKLARDLKVPLQKFTDALKNLTPTSARSDPALSNLSQIIIQLHEIAQRAAKIK